MFTTHGDIDWMPGSVLSLSANARRYVFVLLVVAISAELLQLAWHYVFNRV